MKKKILAILLAALLAASTTACKQATDSISNYDTQNNVENTIEDTIDHDNQTKLNSKEKDKNLSSSCNDNLKGYDPILKIYKNLLADNHMDLESLIEQSEQNFFYELYSLSCNINSEKAGYAIKDLNSDNIDELILLDEDGVLFAVFTLKFGKAVAIDYFSINNNRGTIDANTKCIYKETLSKGNSWGFKITQLLENGDLDCIEFGIYDPALEGVNASAFLYRNGKKEFVDEATVMALYAQYSQHISYSTPTDLISKLDLEFVAC